jgi:hypothetical protein
MKAAAETGQPRELMSQPYDVCGGDGRFVRKVWRGRILPMFDDQHRLIYIVSHIEEVTHKTPRVRG